jgi:hypothetical protein
MSTKLFARALAFVTIVAASCQSDMPSIKRSELVTLVLLLTTGIAVTVGSRVLVAARNWI